MTGRAVQTLAASLFLLTVGTSFAQSGPALASIAPTPSTTRQAPDEQWLAVRINGMDAGTALLTRQADGRLAATRDDVRAWRLRVPPSTTTAASDPATPLVPLDVIDGLRTRIDGATQTLLIDAPAQAFAATTLVDAPVARTPPPAPPGGRLNYDLYASQSGGERRASALLDLAGFGPWGVATTTALVSTGAGATNSSAARVTRLESTLTRDRPAGRDSLRIGDAISRAPAGGAALRFGGVQWASNFATQPDLVTFPLPGASGAAVLPSSVDIFVNDALRARRDVPAGPFSIQDLPVLTGAGEARLVVRDLQGREQVIVQPYYASPQLLRPGLDDFSLEAGLVRNDFGVRSNQYGPAFVAGTQRVGLSDVLTVEGHGEALRSQQGIGLSGVRLLPGVGPGMASLALSRSARGRGAQFGIGIERQASGLSFGAQSRYASPSFRQLGMADAAVAPRRISLAYVSRSLGAWGNLGVNWISQVWRDRPRSDLISASQSVPAGKRMSIVVGLTHVRSTPRATTLMATLSVLLDDRTSLSTGASSSGTPRQLQVQRGADRDGAPGYRLLTDSAGRIEAGVNVENRHGSYVLEGARAHGISGVRANVSGALAVLDGAVRAGPRINDSFGIVELSGYPETRVYANNQLVGRTDADGRILLPRLMPYQNNTVRIAATDLPLDALADTLQMNAVPWLRSGVVLRFPVRRARAARLAIRLDDGAPLPAGAQLRRDDDARVFPVGLRGETWVTGLAARNRLLVDWRGQQCALDVAYADSDDPLPDLGTFICHGVRP